MTYPPTALFSEKINKNIRCESFGCDNEATLTTEVNAGKFGIIILNLCSSCAVKFD